MKEEMMEQTDDKRDCSQIFEEKAMLEIMKREVDPFKSLTIDDVAKEGEITKQTAGLTHDSDNDPTTAEVPVDVVVLTGNNGTCTK